MSVFYDYLWTVSPDFCWFWLALLLLWELCLLQFSVVESWCISEIWLSHYLLWFTQPPSNGCYVTCLYAMLNNLSHFSIPSKSIYLFFLITSFQLLVALPSFNLIADLIQFYMLKHILSCFHKSYFLYRVYHSVHIRMLSYFPSLHVLVVILKYSPYCKPAPHLQFKNYLLQTFFSLNLMTDHY